MPDKYTELIDSKRALVHHNVYSLERQHGAQVMGGFADAHEVVRELLSMRDAYKEVARGIELQGILQDIKEQLAPNQEVRVLFDRESNTIKSIERPGNGYLLGLGDKLSYVPIYGDDEGICHTRLEPETTQFTVRDKESARKKIMLLEDRPERERERERELSDNDIKTDRRREREDNWRPQGQNRLP